MCWGNGQVVKSRKRQFEYLLKQDSQIDENLDDLEKVIEIIQLWFEKGSEFKKKSF